MNKICTSIDQSKKLIELGIDVNTADMYYSPIPVREWKDKNDIQQGIHLVFKEKVFVIEDIEIGEGDVPAWSLSALLELIPSNVFLYLRLVKWDNSYYIEQREMLYDNPIDAAFEMIIWLKENGKI